MNLRLPHAFLILSLMFAGTAFAGGAEDRVAEDYLKAAVTGNAGGMLGFYHPKEITDLRTRVLKILEDEANAGGKTIRGRVFGTVTSLQDLQRLTPDNLYLKLAGLIGLPSESVKEIKALGSVEEGSQLAHVVVRLTPPPEKAGARSRVTLVTLMRHGKSWRVALPLSFQTRVDQLLAAVPDATPAEQVAASTAPAAPNTTGISELLDVSIGLLQAGDCSSYFGESMSPQFRASTAASAMRRLIADCERSVDSRETYIAALQLAKNGAPKYEQNGTRAVYDLSGRGLPFQRFVLEKIEHRWYVAE